MSNHLFSEQNRDIFAQLKDSPSKSEEHANLKLKAWQKRLGLGEQRDALAQFRNAEQKSETLQTEATGELAQKLHLDKKVDVLARFRADESDKRTLHSDQGVTSDAGSSAEEIMLKALQASTNHEPDQPHVPDIQKEDMTIPVVGKAAIVSAAPIAAPVSLLDNEYALAQYVKKLIPMAIIGGHLYLFQAPCFRALDDTEIQTEIKAALPTNIRSEVTMACLKRVVNQLKTEKDLQIDLNAIHYDPHDVVFANGVYDIAAQQMREGRPADCFIAANAAEFHPKKGKNNLHKDTVDRFFAEASGGDSEIEALMWTTIGAMLSTEARFKAFFYLYGPPDTGKSLFGKLIMRLIGQENCGNIQLHEIDAKYHGAELRGKLANINLDQPSVVIKNIGVFKQLTSGGSDVITVEKKFGSIERLDSRFVKFLFAGNHLPRLREYDEAFWSRMVLIPFEYQVPRDRRDPDLIEHLLKGSDYIIRRALKYYAKFLERGMVFPPCQRAEELKFGAESTSPVDRVRQFIAECCELDAEARTLTRDLFDRFYAFCRDHGYHPGSEKAFSSCLKNELGFEPFRYASQRGYCGLRISE